MALNHFETVCKAVITIFVDQKQHELSLGVLHVNTQKKEVYVFPAISLGYQSGPLSFRIVQPFISVMYCGVL